MDLSSLLEDCDVAKMSAFAGWFGVGETVGEESFDFVGAHVCIVDDFRGALVLAALIEVAFGSCDGLRRIFFQQCRGESGESCDVVFVEGFLQGGKYWRAQGGMGEGYEVGWCCRVRSCEGEGYGSGGGDVVLFDIREVDGPEASGRCSGACQDDFVFVDDAQCGGVEVGCASCVAELGDGE